MSTVTHDESATDTRDDATDTPAVPRQQTGNHYEPTTEATATGNTYYGVDEGGYFNAWSSAPGA